MGCDGERVPEPIFWGFSSYGMTHGALPSRIYLPNRIEKKHGPRRMHRIS